MSNDCSILVKPFDIIYLRLKGQPNPVPKVDHQSLHSRKTLLEGYTKPDGSEAAPVVTQVHGRLEFPYRVIGCTTGQEIKNELESVLERK